MSADINNKVWTVKVQGHILNIIFNLLIAMGGQVLNMSFSVIQSKYLCPIFGTQLYAVRYNQLNTKAERHFLEKRWYDIPRGYYRSLERTKIFEDN